jgi:regulator of protease activity HflC (stomatin/prohibitin superfamily)
VKALKRVAVLLLLGIGLIGCSRVEPGYVGIRVSNFGERGVQGEVVQPGKFVWNGPGYQLYEYPVFKQTATWTKANNEAFTFQTSEGLSVSADIGVTYSVDPAKVVPFFKEFRVPIDQITGTYLRNNIRNALNARASSMQMEAVYGPGKVELVKAVADRVRTELAPKGLLIEDVYLLSDLELPDNVRKAINQKILATQMAQQRQNEVAQAEAEAEKAVATATGQADAKLLSAKAEAEAIRIKGDALRENPALIELEKVNAMKIAASRWNGQGGIVPQTVMGSDTPLIFQLPVK